MSGQTPEQLGFAMLLESAAADNAAREAQRECAHLPGGRDEAIAHFRVILRTHHAAMLAGDAETTMRLRREAHLLARKLNGGDRGIIATEDSAGRVLERETAAAAGVAPLWGQTGSFVIDSGAMRVRIEMDGMFGIGAGFSFWPGFSAHVVDPGKPFLSETGYRSFLGIAAAPQGGLLPAEFAGKIIAAHVANELQGRLVAIKPRSPGLD